jgi:nucleotide-binding universal stress UspA family protein
MSAHHETTTGRVDTTRSVVVGVDGSERNRAAVAYAVAEASATGRPVTFLTVLDDYPFPIPHRSIATDDELQWRVLNQLADTTMQEHPGLTVRREVQSGATVATLLDRSAEQELLVVGKRGLGAFGRILVGSTSIGVAGRSHIPVVIVPDSWQQSDRASEPVAVGVDPGDQHQEPLRYALTAARERGVGLTVVSARDSSPLVVSDPEPRTPAYGTGRGAGGPDEFLKPLLEQFPDVAVSVLDRRGHPATSLLDEAGSHQLLVLGRSNDSLVGFAVGSVARGVLHYAEVPVAVVPPG